MSNGHGGKRAGAGRKQHKPTSTQREQVQVMISMGMDHDRIAKVIGISDETLRKHYADELDHGGEKLNMNVTHTLYKKAQNGDTGAAIWITKARLGWSEKVQTEHSGQIDVAGAKDDLSKRLAGAVAATTAIGSRSGDTE